MSYLADYALLKSCFYQEKSPSPIDGTPFEFSRWTFESQSSSLLPGSDEYICHTHGLTFKSDNEDAPVSPSGHFEPSLDIPDCLVENNRRFEYRILAPSGSARHSSVILLLHGLNEKQWEKYLPWALGLIRRTGRPVILMPLAFHMNRAPGEWCQSRRMQRLAEHRQATLRSISASSFTNAAISTRLHEHPQRFFWSGLQSCEDVLALARMLRTGEHPMFEAGAKVDIFSYSIGSFLSQILLMADQESLFSASRLFLFCGGPTLDRMYSTAKAILDSEAVLALYSFFVEHLEAECRRDARLAHYLSDAHPAGPCFRMMLSYYGHQAARESRLRECARRLRAVALRGDTVIRPGEVIATLKGEARDIDVDVHVLDFPYPYTHVTPFSLQPRYESDTEDALDTVLDLAAGHFA